MFSDGDSRAITLRAYAQSQHIVDIDTYDSNSLDKNVIFLQSNTYLE